MRNFPRAQTVGLLSLFLASLLAGCASDSQSNSLSPSQLPAASESQATTPTVEGENSPEPSPTSTSQDQDGDGETAAGFDAFAFSATTLNGSAFDVEALRGEPTLFWFWTPWCTVCRAEAPGIASLEAVYGDRINFVGVAAQGTASEMVNFAAETGVTGFPHLADLDSGIWAHFGVPYQPSFVFVTDSGEVTLSVGSRSVAELEIELQELIG